VRREPAVTALHMRAIEPVLGMASGYVLDFSNEALSGFFADFGVNIDAPTYAANGTSKAKRLRQFLRVASPSLCSKVLLELMRHRLAMSGPPVTDSECHAYMEVIVELDGGNADVVAAIARLHAQHDDSAPAAADDLPRPAFDPTLLDGVPLDPAVRALVVARIEEAQACERVSAFLSATILLGSVLEAMCLGFGQANRSEVLALAAKSSGKPRSDFDRWMLQDWIEHLGALGALSQNVVKNYDGLRQFRNYIHPTRQLAEKFAPDARTVEIAYRVVMFAAQDLSRDRTAAGG
jgi:hypothetical protein